jgi:serine/threonine protein kinase
MKDSKDEENPYENYSYILLKPVGNGAFGMVYQTKIEETSEIVATKKVYQDKRYKNRELSILKQLNHPNTIYLYHSYYQPASDNKDEQYLFLITDWIPDTLQKTLRNFMRTQKQIPLIYLKLYSYQIIRALAYIHSLGICHRDIKPPNILVDPETQILKLCDFGSAKILVRGEPNVSYIASRPYRAPELIFGAIEYTTAIDIWASGCVIAELVLGDCIFQGSSSLEQIVEIIKVLGTPNRLQIQAMNPEYKEYRFPVIKPLPWEKVFKGKKLPEEFFDLIGKMLIYDPSKRTKPLYLLAHHFFDELRMKGTKLPNGKNLPDLFNFNEQEMSIDSEFINEKLIPDWYKEQ